MLFRKHEESGCHKDATQVIITIPKDTPDVGEMLSHTLAKYFQTFGFWHVKGVPSEVTMMNHTAISHNF